MTETSTTSTTAESLREWARGVYATEAATELLIRTGFAREGHPWVIRRHDDGWWIDFEMIPSHIGAMSSGERAVLLLAASIGAYADPVEISLEALLTSIDRPRMDLVLAAISHAAGTHQGTRFITDPDTGRFTGFEPVTESLHPWPTDEGIS